MLETELWQDNGGGIHAIMHDGKDLINVICHLEIQPTLSTQELISACYDGFPGADPYDPDEYDGLTAQQLANEITRRFDADGTPLVEPCQRIAVFNRDEITLYPRCMGYNALSLFGLTEFFSERMCPMNYLLAQGNHHALIFTPGQDGYTSHRFMVALDYDPIQSMCRQYFIYNNLPAAYNRFQELETEFAGQPAQGV